MGKSVIILLLSLISVGACAQQNWQLRKDDDGIKIYTANTPNSNFKSVKVELIINAKPSQLVAFLMDIPRQHDWIYNNKVAYIVRKISDNEFITYSEYNVAWPCSNRDYVARVVFRQQAPGQVVIDSHSEPDLLPAKEGKIRVKKSEAHWDITTLPNGQLKVVYTVHCDPAGAVPAWLMNIFLTKAPHQTFKKLKEEVPKYQAPALSFIKD